MSIVRDLKLRGLALLLAIALVLPGAPALAQMSDAFPPAISVTGEARISVAPDIAFVDAGVATDAKTAREIKWLPYTEAAALVAEPELKRLILRFGAQHAPKAN